MVYTVALYAINIFINFLLWLWVSAVVYRTRSSIQHGPLFVLQRSSILIGSIFIISFPNLNGPLNIVLAHVLFASASFLSILYLTQITHRMFNYVYQIPLYIGFILAFVYYSYQEPSLKIQYILISSVYLLQMLPIFYHNIRTKYINKPYFKLAYGVNYLFALSQVLFVFVVIFTPSSNNLYQGNLYISSLLVLMTIINIMNPLFLSGILLFFHHRSIGVYR